MTPFNVSLEDLERAFVEAGGASRDVERARAALKRDVGARKLIADTRDLIEHQAKHKARYAMLPLDSLRALLDLAENRR